MQIKGRVNIWSQLISRVLIYVSIVIIGIVIMYLGIRFAFGTYNPFYVVASGSMIPTLNNRSHWILTYIGNFIT